MYSIIQSSHSYFALVALAMIVFALITAALPMLSKKPFTATNLKIALWGLIAGHIQLLFGLLLYVLSPHGFNNISGATMKDPAARLLAVEHPIVNLLAIIIITIGYSKAKKVINFGNSGKTILIYYGMGLLLLLSRIPWNSWLSI